MVSHRNTDEVCHEIVSYMAATAATDADWADVWLDKSPLAWAWTIYDMIGCFSFLSPLPPRAQFIWNFN
jgi:hypothetical protein